MVVVRVRSAGVIWPGGRVGADAIDYEASGGRIAVLLGPNGSGKTTLLRLLAGDLRAQSGEILRDGTDAAAQSIGYATDVSAHFDELTGRQNAHWFARAAGGSAAAADALLDRFGLAPDADVPAGEYSFGMRRKLVLVQALAHSPRLILLDEPTIGLDPAGTLELHGLLRERAAAGAAIVIATNDTRLARDADHVSFLHHGRIIARGAPAEMLEAVRGRTRIEFLLESPLAQPLAPPEPVASAADGASLVFESVNGSADLPMLCEAVARAGGLIRRIDVSEPGFEDVFRRLTGEALETSDGLTGAPAASRVAGRRAGARPRRGPPWRRR